MPPASLAPPTPGPDGAQALLVELSDLLRVG